MPVYYSLCRITLMTPIGLPCPDPSCHLYLSSQIPDLNRILNTHSPILKPMVQCRIEWLSWAEEAFGNGAGLGIPLCLCPNWVSRFLLTLLSARWHGNSLREERETSFNHHILQSECSAPETSQETRTNAHIEAPCALTCEKGLEFLPPPPGEEGHTDPEGWGLALFA